MKALITGSAGLIGSACVGALISRGWEVIGIDNDMRLQFFGPAGSTAAVVASLKDQSRRYHHIHADIRYRQLIETSSQSMPRFHHSYGRPPSHDLAAKIPYDDFDVNAVGTLYSRRGLRFFSRISVLLHKHQQGLWRPAELAAVDRAATCSTTPAACWRSLNRCRSRCLLSLFAPRRLRQTSWRSTSDTTSTWIGICRCGCLSGPQLPLSS